ncbi:hypothetical protein, partial [Piscinibacter defluvii]|uniref:hypothetical protein n=1 Tax=Piscinibacter defluvii TaxID=1796922 RepID=UPI00197B2639
LGTWAARRSLASCASRPKRQSAAVASAQTLGVMRQRFAIQQFIREFLEALAHEFRTFLGLPGKLEVVAEENNRFVALVGRREVVADKVSQQVRTGGRLVAPFKAITAIEVAYTRKGDDHETWEVALRLLRNRRVSLGRLADDTDASILAAKLSTITGAQVVSTV